MKILSLGFFPHDLQLYLSNDQACGKPSGSKDWQKNFKHLSNFPSVGTADMCRELPSGIWLIDGCNITKNAWVRSVLRHFMGCGLRLAPVATSRSVWFTDYLMIQMADCHILASRLHVLRPRDRLPYQQSLGEGLALYDCRKGSTLVRKILMNSGGIPPCMNKHCWKIRNWWSAWYTRQCHICIESQI